MVTEPQEYIAVAVGALDVSDKLSDTFTCPASNGDDKQAQPQAIRHGVAAAQGQRRRMEDAAVAHTSLQDVHLPHVTQDELPQITGLFGVFDGHCGSHAATFASERILKRVTGSNFFPSDIKASLAQAFIQIDHEYHAAVTGSDSDSAGTTALAAVVWGNTVYVANAGDSRAVLSSCGRALDLTRDHKPHQPAEKERIELCGGYVCDRGYLCGQLAVARAIGDYHLPGLKKQASTGVVGPLIAEPELTEHELAATDEFILLGCDGLWDVFSSQRAVEFARTRLRHHNDPQRCAEELVAEALRMHSGDNITVITVCFGNQPPKRRIYGRSAIALQPVNGL